MCEVESSVLTQLMVTYCKALLNEKNFICKYSEKVLNAYYLVQKEDQEKIMICLKEAIFLGPHPSKSIKILPRKLKNAMQISI